MLEAPNQLRLFQDKAVQCPCKRHQHNFVRRARFANWRVQKGGGCSGRRRLKSRNDLEREVYAGADHTEVIIWSVYEIPAEITDPTDVRRKTDLNPTADLTDRLGLRSRETFCLDNVKAFSLFNHAYIFGR